MSEAAQEFFDRISDATHESGDRVDLHDGAAEPVTVVVPPETPAADRHLLFQRLRSHGYEVDKEWGGDGTDRTGSAYLLSFPDERGEQP